MVKRQPDPQEEARQLEKLSAQINDKRKEVQAFDKHMEEAQAHLDKQRDAVDKLRKQLLEDSTTLSLKWDEYEKKKKELDTEFEGIAMKKASLDRLAKASDERLILASKQEEENKRVLREIERKQNKVDDGCENLKKELEGKLEKVKELEQLRLDEYRKAEKQLEALKKEREDISGNKHKYEVLAKEIEATKGEYATKMNQIRDKEEEFRKLAVDLKNREQNCANREKLLQDGEIELEAKWAKLNRKIEIMGFTKELELAKKDAV